MTVGQSTGEIHQAAGKNRSRAARGQVWSLMKMTGECRNDEMRAGARGAPENTSFYLGWRMKREGCRHRAVVKVRETWGQIKIWKVLRWWGPRWTRDLD